MRRDYPRMPAKGTSFKKGTIDTLQKIIDFLPKLDVTGDNKTIAVDNAVHGNIIRALPQRSGGQPTITTATSAPVADYDGPWSISDVYVEDNVHYVDVKGGFYTLNGYVREYWQTTKLNINDAYYNGKQFFVFLHVKYGPMQTHPLDDQVLIQTSVELHSYDWTPIYGYHENESYFPLAGILRTYGEWKNECFRVAMPQMMLFGAIPV